MVSKESFSLPFSLVYTKNSVWLMANIILALPLYLTYCIIWNIYCSSIVSTFMKNVQKVQYDIPAYIKTFLSLNDIWRDHTLDRFQPLVILLYGHHWKCKVVFKILHDVNCLNNFSFQISWRIVHILTSQGIYYCKSHGITKCKINFSELLLLFLVYNSNQIKNWYVVTS